MMKNNSIQNMATLIIQLKWENKTKFVLLVNEKKIDNSSRVNFSSIFIH